MGVTTELVLKKKFFFFNCSGSQNREDELPRWSSAGKKVISVLPFTAVAESYSTFSQRKTKLFFGRLWITFYSYFFIVDTTNLPLV